MAPLKKRTPKKNRTDRQLRRSEGKKRGISRVKAVLLVLALIVTIVPALVLAHPISYMAPIAIVLLVVVSYIYLRVLKHTLEYDEGLLVDSCTRGDKVSFEVGLKNRSFLPHPRLELYFYVSDLFGNYDALMQVTTTLGALESKTFPFEASFAHIGTYSAGLSKLVVHDLLGLFSTEIVNEKRHEVSVSPRVFDLEKVDLSSVSAQESKNQSRPIVTDDMDYAGVRDYQLGDPMKTVHWNLSSRNPSGELYTRLFEVYANPGLSIVIDPFAPPYDAEGLMTVFDGLVESAVSMDAYARLSGVDREVVFLDRSKERASLFLVDAGSADELVRLMMPVVPEEQNRLDAAFGVDLLRQVGNSTHGHGNVAFCTARLNEEIISALIEIRNHRRNPLLFLAVPGQITDEDKRVFVSNLRRLDSAGVGYCVVKSTFDATEVSGL